MKHNGMRPQDVVVLIKIIHLNEQQWQYRDLANALFISVSEVSQSLSRSALAGLYNSDMRTVYRGNLFDFLVHGLRYVFPQVPGSLVIGLETAHSHPQFKGQLIGDSISYVWPYTQGNVRGQAIEPLYEGAPKASVVDPELYLQLAALDMIRVGKTRERNLAIEVLREHIL